MMITMTTIIMMPTMMSILGVYNGFFFFFWVPKEINDHSLVFSIKKGECYPILVTL